MQKPRAYAEIYNDLDGEVVNVFRVLRHPGQAAELERLLRLTPFAREERDAAYNPSLDPVEQARRTIVKCFMTHGSDAIRRRSGFRSQEYVPGTGHLPSHDWQTYPNQIRVFLDRMQGVVIENREAVDVIRLYDSRNTLHYLDPPYPLSTRTDPGSDYRHEMTDDDHRELAEVLHSVKGMVVISGYPCELYDEELYPDWHRVERPHLADGARPRTEVLWLSPRAAEYQRQVALW